MPLALRTPSTNLGDSNRYTRHMLQALFTLPKAVANNLVKGTTLSTNSRLRLTCKVRPLYQRAQFRSRTKGRILQTLHRIRSEDGTCGANP